MLVSRLMTTDPITIDADAPVSGAVRAMFENDIRHLPVVRGTRLVGMLSDRDVRGLVVPAIFGSESTANVAWEQTVGGLMSSDPMTVAADADVDDVIELMLEYKVGAVPVCDSRDGTLTGIVSYTDVLRACQGKL